jgi:DNA primase
MTNWVDFRALKHRIGIESVLEHYGVRLKRVHRHYLRGCFPLPTHSSEQSRESFGVHTVNNVWACHSASCCQARQGKLGGTILDLVAYMEGCTIREAALRLQARWGWEAGGAPAADPLVSKERSAGRSQEELSRLPFCLPLRAGHPYLEQRGIDRQTAAQFGVGYYAGRGFLQGRIVFPIHDERGELVAYAGRAVNGAEPRYLFPTGFRKSQVVFNFHRAVAATTQQPGRVIVVEGFFDCLKVHQAGYGNVVAVMGASLSEKQWELLQTRFREVIVMLDGDEAGRRASRLLCARWPVTCLARVPAGRQPDQLSPDEIQRILRRVARCAPGEL